MGALQGEAPEAITVDTADGVGLALQRVPARGRRRAVLLCTHAMMANGRYFGAAREVGFAAHLADRGLEVFVLDWRGHGGSKPPRAHTDRWSFDDYVELDLPAALAAVAAAAGVPVAELAVLGHSLGGLVALAALGTGRVPAVRRLALAATSVWLPGPGGPLGRRLAMAAYGAVTRLRGHAPIRALRLGTEDESADYVEQLAGWARTGRWTSRPGVDYLASLAAVEAPVWAFCGDGDRLCRPADAEALRGRVRGAAPLRVVGQRHGDALDPDHFALFTDGRMAPVWDQLIDFVIG